MKSQSKVDRVSESEIAVSRTINGPSRIVFEAWANPELFNTWWVPKSAPITLVSCKMEVRTGGRYHLGFKMGDQSAEFFGKYLEVIPYSRIVWTNEEGGEGDATITTVTFKEIDGKTLVTVHDLYPSKVALDEAIATGSSGAMPEQLDQLDRFIVDQRNR